MVRRARMRERERERSVTVRGHGLGSFQLLPKLKRMCNLSPFIPHSHICLGRRGAGRGQGGGVTAVVVEAW